ncbi:161_t:CDS:2, partial [Ambispora gerdemannii]
METGVSLSKLSILDAIQITVTAWDKVTTNTIKNCWIKTEILSLSYDDTKIILSELEEKNNNNILVNNFLSIDDKLLLIEDYEKSTEQEIINCILGKNTEIEVDENASEEIIDITNKKIIECFEKLQKYLNQEN